MKLEFMKVRYKENESVFINLDHLVMVLARDGKDDQPGEKEGVVYASLVMSTPIVGGRHLFDTTVHYERFNDIMNSIGYYDGTID